MASKNFTGFLRSSLGSYASHDLWRFTHISTTGEVVAGSAAQFKVDSSGFYDIDVEYGNVVIESKNSLTRRWFNHGVTTINSDTSVTTLPALLNALVPASDSVILQMQALLSDTESAKNDALQAKVDTESLFNNFDSSVADSVSRVGAFKPDVYIPFNDSLEIVRGYGTHDQIDVSAAQDGSIMVDLPSKSVDFSRASGRTVINKSGELVTLGVDEPAIGSDGLGVYGSYKNEMSWSEDFSQAAWTKHQIGVTSDVIESPENGVFADLVEDLDGNDRYLRQTGSILTTENGCASAFFKRGSQSSKCGIRLALTGGIQPDFGFIAYDFDTDTLTPPGETDHYGIEKLTDGWVFLWVAYENLGGNTVFDAQFFPSDTINATPGDDVYVWGEQFTKTLTPMPYIKTESTPITSSPDVASIPMRNNMPAAGQPFTICCDVAFPLGHDSVAFGVVPTIGTTDSRAFMLRRVGGSGNIQFYYDDAGGADKPINVANIDDTVHRFTCVYDGVNHTRLYIDGVLGGANGTHGEKSHEGLNFIQLGRWGSGVLNSTIKNFEIYHRALTDDEIKAKGAVK